MADQEGDDRGAAQGGGATARMGHRSRAGLRRAGRAGESLHERAAVRVAAYVGARHVRPVRPGLSGEARIAGALSHLPQPSPPVPDEEDEPVVGARRAVPLQLEGGQSGCYDVETGGVPRVPVAPENATGDGAPPVRIENAWLMSR